MTDPITVHKKAIEIEGGRELYNYTFEIEVEGESGIRKSVNQRDEGTERRGNDESTKG